MESKHKFRNIKFNSCSIIDGVFYYNERLWVPEYMFIELIQKIHDQPTVKHPGITQTKKLLKREYYWRGMRKTITQYIGNCYLCHRTKISRNRQHGFIKPLPIFHKGWRYIGIHRSFY